jgi:hypothetical protein
VATLKKSRQGGKIGVPIKSTIRHQKKNELKKGMGDLKATKLSYPIAEIPMNNNLWSAELKGSTLITLKPTIKQTPQPILSLPSRFRTQFHEIHTNVITSVSRSPRGFHIKILNAFLVSHPILVCPPDHGLPYLMFLTSSTNINSILAIFMG